MTRKELTGIRFSIASCPLGYLLLAASDRGICVVHLGDDVAELEQGLRFDYPVTEIARDDAGLETWMEALLCYLRGEELNLDMPLDVEGSRFQMKVWRQLQAIPRGETLSYTDLARAVDHPKAVRAAANACAANPVALIVPCHRVIREDGGLGGYRGGVQRKMALLELESRSLVSAK